MSDFGTKGLFVCAVIGGLIAIDTVGWPAVFGTFGIIYGYVYLLGTLNSFARPDGSLRSRRDRRRRGCRW